MDTDTKQMGAPSGSPLRWSRFPGFIRVNSGASVVNKSAGLGCGGFKDYVTIPLKITLVSRFFVRPQ